MGENKFCVGFFVPMKLSIWSVTTPYISHLENLNLGVKICILLELKKGTPMNNTFEMRITMSPEISGGAPCIRGTRIRVVDIAIYYEIYGWSPETIVEELEGITLADVHSALAYYFDNIEQFRKQAQEENVLIENLRKNLPSALKKKLLGTA